MLYRRTREEMPAMPEEIEDALDEGLMLYPLVAPVAIEKSESGQMVRCLKMKLGETDNDGRRRPVPKPGSDFLIQADSVIVAVGQKPKLDFAKSDERLAILDDCLDVHPLTQRVDETDVFAGGDVVTGPATIIEAIAAGQRAARAIDIFLGGKGVLPPDTIFAPGGKLDENESGIPRQQIPVRPVSERQNSFREVVEGFSEEIACAEAKRCLRCNLDV